MDYIIDRLNSKKIKYKTFENHVIAWGLCGALSIISESEHEEFIEFNGLLINYEQFENILNGAKLERSRRDDVIISEDGDTDTDFNELRATAIEEMDAINTGVLTLFFYKIGHKGIVGYENDLVERVFTIWTDRPGILIGKGGKNVAILKEILKVIFEKDYEVEFKLIRGRLLVIE